MCGCGGACPVAEDGSTDLLTFETTLKRQQRAVEDEDEEQPPPYSDAHAHATVDEQSPPPPSTPVDDRPTSVDVSSTATPAQPAPSLNPPIPAMQPAKYLTIRRDYLPIRETCVINPGLVSMDGQPSPGTKNLLVESQVGSVDVDVWLVSGSESNTNEVGGERAELEVGSRTGAVAVKLVRLIPPFRVFSGLLMAMDVVSSIRRRRAHTRLLCTPRPALCVRRFRITLRVQCRFAPSMEAFAYREACAGGWRSQFCLT